MTQSLSVDVLVIGWGKGGKTLAGALGRAGRRVALVERSAAMYGGTCINVACVPTKSLVHQADQRRQRDDPQAWFTASVGARDALIGRLNAANHQMLATVDTVTLIDGAARFVGPHEIEVRAPAGSDADERLRVTATTIVVNTGTEPARLDIPGADGPTVYNSTTLQHANPFPQRLVIVGAGPIGLEFAGMFSGFGSQVTVLARGERLLPGEDADVADAVEELLRGRGVSIVHGAHVEQITTTQVTATGKAYDADAVLVATGRVPVTGELGLDAAGIVTDERGFIVVDEQLRTSVPGVYAVGDVNGGPQFTYISLDDYRIALDQITGPGRRSTADRVAVPRTTFLTPPLSRVGLTEAQARRRPGRVLVASKKVADIAAMPRPKILGETHGLIKALVDADTDLLLGATVFCTDSQEIINLIALAMRAGVTATQLRDGIWTHPSSTEALNEVLGTLTPLN